MDNFSNAEKSTITVEIERIMNVLSDNINIKAVNIHQFSAALAELRVNLKLDKTAWFAQLRDIYVDLQHKNEHSALLQKIKLRLISLWNILSSPDKIRIANPVGKRIVYPKLDALDVSMLHAQIQRAIAQGEIEYCKEVNSMLQENDRRLSYFSSDGLNEPIFELNYNSQEGVIDFFNTNEKSEILHKFILMTFHDAIIKA